MAFLAENSNPFYQQPLIFAESLRSTKLYEILSKVFKTRVSKSILSQICIFPKYSVAFLVSNFSEITLNNQDETSQEITDNLNEEFISRLEHFQNIHRNTYVVLMNCVWEAAEVTIVFKLQKKFFLKKCKILLAVNEEECAKHILTIVKVSCPPVDKIVQDKIRAILESSLTEETILQLIRSMGLCEYESTLAVDGCENLSGIASADISRLQDCSLEASSAKVIINFCEENKYYLKV
ncbi:uncharacterized protein C1orf146-like isoform X1 [Limulus polyphemus]|uniref:Uncharacterized protein C1orf146-like isoform X1 n=1 Tax=Limulus polyphemus TaxID=6850 RepID=A0ABM1BET2_LIMPO|nr:uncharacterized protein C1orf146-like isoform X1 [Limulus polyphemus]